jgi:protease-4
VLGCFFLLSLLFNVAAVAVLLLGCLGVLLRMESADSERPLVEKRYSGSATAVDKIAIVSLDGVILEGLMSFTHLQIDQAARDAHVKAVVLRINSPGGSVTASDELYRRLTELNRGNARKGTAGKPLVVSIGSLAASGGYYAAMPAQTLFAEPTSITGSIGVFMSLPNVKQLADRWGVHMEIIKQGEIKDSGSPFRDLTPKEREVWQDLINTSYNRFVHIVEQARPALKGALLTRRTIQPVRVGRAREGANAADKGPAAYTRYLADGGVWTAEQALAFSLVDKIGSLEDAIDDARDRAGLGEAYRVIRYERPFSLVASLVGLRAPDAPATVVEAGRLQHALGPRLWYLAGGHEAAAFAAALAECDTAAR